MSADRRIEPLGKNNYDPWCIQVKALLVKSDGWPYVSGKTPKPESSAELAKWELGDLKAQSDLILSISTSELRQIKDCKTSREIWLKLESTYNSKGPARKAALLKQLTLSKMKEGEDVRQHLDRFFNAVDKLGEMNLEINGDLLSIMLLNSLPASYENFRCAIETRDELPTTEVLKIKIVEETDARQNREEEKQSDALFARRQNSHNGGKPKKHDNSKPKNNLKFKGSCNRCKKIGHKAIDCWAKLPDEAGNAKEIALNASANDEASYQITNWCLDSGATSHMTADGGTFKSLKKTSKILQLANNFRTSIDGVGDIQITVPDGGNGKRATLTQVLHVPDLRTNLMSVSKITDQGHEVTFKKNVACVKNKKQEMLAIAARKGNYFVQGNSEKAYIAERYENSKLMTWHERLGHLNERNLKQMFETEAVIGMKLSKTEQLGTCEICIKGKQVKHHFPKRTSKRSSELVEIVHTDVCGPMRTASTSGAKYFVIFIDDKSRWCEVYFIAKKSEVLTAFKKYKAQVENLLEKRIKYIQSDNGTEFCNMEFDDFLQMNGIQRKLTVPYTPEQNGVAERKNHLLRLISDSK